MIEFNLSGCYHIHAQDDSLYGVCLMLQFGSRILGLLRTVKAAEYPTPSLAQNNSENRDVGHLVAEIQDIRGPRAHLRGVVTKSFSSATVKKYGQSEFEATASAESLMLIGKIGGTEVRLTSWFQLSRVQEDPAWTDFISREFARVKPWNMHLCFEQLQQPVKRLLQRSDFDTNVFVMMRFVSTPQNDELRQAIRSSVRKYGLSAQFADELAVSDELWNNVSAYLLGCRFGIAVIEQIEERSFNPNVALEIGFMRAHQKKVLVLKDRRVPRMPADLMGSLYREFDSYAIPDTMPPQIEAWLQELRQLGEIEEKPPPPGMFIVNNDVCL